MTRILFIVMLAIMTMATAMAQTDFRNLSYDEALAAAKAENKLVFIDMHTSWCGPCKMMTRDIFPKPEAGKYFNEKYVCVKYDAEKEGVELAKKFKVTAFPTFVVVDGDDNLIFTTTGSNPDVNEFINTIENGVNPNYTKLITERYERGERTAEIVKNYAMNVISPYRKSRNDSLVAAKRAEARKIIDEYFMTLTDSDRLQDENAFVFSYNYFDGLNDPKVRFCLNNRSLIDDKRLGELRKLYYIEMNNMLTGNTPYNPNLIRQIEEEAALLGFDDTKDISIPCQLITCHATCDAGTFISKCDELYPQMTKSTQSRIISAIDKNIDLNDKTAVSCANRFIRSKLYDMDPMAIYSAAMVLMNIERGDQE